MKLRGLIGVLLFFGYTNVGAVEEGAILPSEQTHQQLEQMYTMDNQASSPSLRSGPPGGGGPPIGGTPIGELPILALITMSVGYVMIRNRKKQVN